MRRLVAVSIVIVSIVVIVLLAAPRDAAPVEAGPSLLDLRQASGIITLLRVHDVGTGYGPPSDFIDVEVVIQLDTTPGKAFGFQLRDDANRPVRQGMLDLLRDAFNNNWTVTVDYSIDPGKNNGVIMRVWLTK
jgi:hypothetical protein